MTLWIEIMKEELKEKYTNFFEGRTNLTKEEIEDLVEKRIKETYE